MLIIYNIYTLFNIYFWYVFVGLFITLVNPAVYKIRKLRAKIIFFLFWRSIQFKYFAILIQLRATNRQILGFFTWFFSDAETMLHLLKGSLGTGILAMPRAIYHAGYIVGVIATIIIGLLCIYCMRILVRSEYELCKRKRVPSLSYPATAESALLEGPMILRRFSKASMWVCYTFF